MDGKIFVVREILFFRDISLKFSIVKEEKSASSFKIEFHTINILSGTYFYKLNAGSFSETKKMVLLK